MKQNIIETLCKTESYTADVSEAAAKARQRMTKPLDQNESEAETET